MLQYTTVFLIIALIAATFGIGAAVTGATDAAATLFLIFVGLSAGGLVCMLRNRSDPWAGESLDTEAAPANERFAPAGGSDALVSAERIAAWEEAGGALLGSPPAVRPIPARSRRRPLPG
jgi:uncharacterized membrane protein YtjA (UPF0391 family)